MAKQITNLVKLGVFVVSGILILIIALFLIGKNQHLIGSHFPLKTHFSNVGGLRTGNNVRYAGIEVGTVKSIEIMNDTTIEVTIMIGRELKNVIRKNAQASLGADGLMGNKVVNIMPGTGPSDLVGEGDLLPSQPSIEFDDILRTMAGTVDNINFVSGNLRETVSKINNSKGLWKLLGDTSLATHLSRASHNLEKATLNAEKMTLDVREIVADVKSGKGPAGTILRDTAMAASLKTSIDQLQKISTDAGTLAGDLDSMVSKIDQDVQAGPGPANLVLKDTAVAGNIRRTLAHVERGTASFNENMEAIKHNFLFRGYFRKQEKEKAKQAQKQ